VKLQNRGAVLELWLGLGLKFGLGHRRGLQEWGQPWGPNLHA